MTHGATFFSAVAGAPWDDVVPLARVLEVPLSAESATLSAAHARALWKKLSYLGSNELAYLLRGFEGIDYPEIVRDVGKQLKLSELQPGEEERVVEHNEQLVLAKIFADAWEHLDSEERREHLREMNLDEGHLPLPGARVAAAVFAGQAGPFAIYKLSLLVANSAARALPAGRLSPARRKTAQAVALIASLRQAQRTALAATELAAAPPSAETPAAETPAASPRQPRKRNKRTARKKAGQRPPAPATRPRKKAAPARKAAAKSGAKQSASQKKARGKKTGKKKRRSRPAAP
jgi:hypothetical protein